MDSEELFEKVRTQYAENVFSTTDQEFKDAVRMPSNEEIKALCEVIAPMLGKKVPHETT